MVLNLVFSLSAVSRPQTGSGRCPCMKRSPPQTMFPGTHGSAKGVLGVEFRARLWGSVPRSPTLLSGE